MERSDVINHLASFLRIHLDNPSGIRQGNYRTGFFKLFQEAYRNRYFDGSPNLHADCNERCALGEVAKRFDRQTVRSIVERVFDHVGRLVFRRRELPTLIGG